MSASPTNPSESLYLAIDQGGQSSRIGVFDQTGQLLCSYSAACATQHIQTEQGEHIEQRGEEILAGIRTCLSQVQDFLGARISQIKAAGFAGQGSSLLCWDRLTGEALTPVLSWQDIRGQDYLSSISIFHQQAQQLTGLRISPHYGASKIRWCLEHSAQVKNALAQNRLAVGPIVSYVFWHLLEGNPLLVDPGHAQRTLLWNLQQEDWDEFLLAQFKIPREILPQCKKHNSRFGLLDIAGNKIPFSAAARDQGASLFANGQPDTSACYINIGTGAFIQRVSNQLQAPDGLLVSPLWLPQINTQASVDVASPTCYLDPSEFMQAQKIYAWEATVNGAASAISFIEQQTGLTVNPQIIAQALALEPPQGCYFLNAIGGLSAPYWRTDLTSRFSDGLKPLERVLAWLESVVFQIVLNVQLMEALSKAQKIIISGGLSQADGICQRIADLTGACVYRSENADATLRGIGCMAAGAGREGEVSTWSVLAASEEFMPRHNLALMHRYSNWKAQLDAWLQVAK